MCLWATIGEYGKGWAPLDPSFKQYIEKPGIDLSTELPFDIEGLLIELKNSAIIGNGGFSVTGIDEEIISEKIKEYKE